MLLELTINGRRHKLDTEPSRRLLDILRDDLGLTGTKEGCGQGECGTCTVILNGAIVNSCLVLAAQINGAEVVTIENPVLNPIRERLIAAGGIQCGFCTPGIIVSMHALLQEHPRPSENQIRRGLSGNLCRCTGYTKIFQAFKLLEEGA
ncbi:MAG: (2Fe-2S)-binding protein [Candidatus Hodarchaeales archaeon]|jgi:carbon-monoxide dehydrogenase small subunit